MELFCCGVARGRQLRCACASTWQRRNATWPRRRRKVPSGSRASFTSAAAAAGSHPQHLQLFPFLTKKLKLIGINLIGFDSSGASEDGRHLTGCWMLPRHVRINADAATSVRFLREFFIIKYGNAVKYKSIAQLALYSNNSHYVKCGNVVEWKGIGQVAALPRRFIQIF